MAQDIRKLFEDDHKASKQIMPKGHEDRFLQKLETEFPEKKQPKRFTMYQVAASLIVLLGLSFGAYQFFKSPIDIVEPEQKQEVVTLKSLGDVSPDLKKVEDYYIANINLELSKVKLTKDNKEVFDGYIAQLEELNKEYERLTVELTENGPNELTVSALIDNLKWRLNLLYRLKEQLNQLNTSEETLQNDI
jgi:hypothetical protein